MTNVPGSGAVQGQALPGWIASIAIHLLFLSACAIGLQSCQETAGEDGAGEFRDG